MTDSAAVDLEELDEFILSNDSVASADYVLGRLDEVIGTLAVFPERGNYPPELSALGIQDYREFFFKPYRVIYRVLEKRLPLPGSRWPKRYANLTSKTAVFRLVLSCFGGIGTLKIRDETISNY